MLYSTLILLLFALVIQIPKSLFKLVKENSIQFALPFIPLIVFFEIYLKSEWLLFLLNLGFIFLTVLLSILIKRKRFIALAASLCLFFLCTYFFFLNNIFVNNFQLSINHPLMYLIGFLPLTHLFLVDLILRKRGDASISKFLLLFGFGFVAFIGFFVANLYGSYFITLGYLLSGLFFSNFNHRIKFIPLVIFLAQVIFFNLLDAELILLNGDVLLGLFAGLGISFLTTSYNESRKTYRNQFLKFAFFVSLFFAFFFLGTQKTDLGGLDTCFLLILGVFVGAFWNQDSKEFKVNLSLIFIGIASLLFFDSPDKDIKDDQESQIEKEFLLDESIEKAQEFSLEDKGFLIDTLQGIWLSDQEKSSLEFELGPKGGITKGKFKAFNVQLERKETLTLNVQLFSKDLTTKNRSRDESIYEAAYLNVEKFPTMRFYSNEFLRQKDAYLIRGEFEMLGVKKEVSLYTKVTSFTGNELIFLGEGSLDRSLFGMTPDSKEGNVVSFHFKVHFKKKI
jgi:polyisoprenoid-binding protein YceI